MTTVSSPWTGPDSGAETGPPQPARSRDRARRETKREVRFTGIPLVIESLERNGSPPLRILTDPLRTYFKAVLGIHPDFLEQAEYDDDSPIEDRIASVLRSSGCLSLREISQSLGYKGINKTVSEAVKGMISEGRLEYLIPDKPRSPKQRICLRR